LMLFSCFCRLTASCPSEVCVSGFEAFSLFVGTYEKQSEGVYHQQYGLHGLIEAQGNWYLVDKGEDANGRYIEYYTKSVAASACPSGASYRGANGKVVPMKVGTCDSDDEAGGSVGGVVGGLILCCCIAACVAFCWQKGCCQGHKAAKSLALPAAVGEPVVVVAVAAQPVDGPVTVAAQPVGAMAQPTAEKKLEAADKTSCHNLKLSTFWKMTWCANCKAMLLGLSDQGYACQHIGCGLIVCPKCHAEVSQRACGQYALSAMQKYGELAQATQKDAQL